MAKSMPLRRKAGKKPFPPMSAGKQQAGNGRIGACFGRFYFGRSGWYRPEIERCPALMLESKRAD
jgi:hypothetical protein